MICFLFPLLWRWCNIFQPCKYKSIALWENAHSNLHMVAVIKLCLQRALAKPCSGVVLSLLVCSQTLHACWAGKVQMGGGRWVISTMLFPLKGTRLPWDGQLSSMNCRGAAYMWHMWADGRRSFPTDGTPLPHGVEVSSQWQVSKCRKTQWESDSRLDLPESLCGEQWNLLSRCLPSVTHSSKTQRSHYLLRWCKPCQSFRSIIWAMRGICSWPCLLLRHRVQKDKGW